MCIVGGRHGWKEGEGEKGRGHLTKPKVILLAAFAFVFENHMDAIEEALVAMLALSTLKEGRKGNVDSSAPSVLVVTAGPLHSALPHF